MKKNVRSDFFELLNKCRTWIDREIYIPPIFRRKSHSDRFKEKILDELAKTMEAECFHISKNQILIPTIYKIFISYEDNADFFGVKRDALFKILNDYVKNCLKLLSIETAGNRFVQIYPTQELKKDSVRIIHYWESDSPIDIKFNNHLARPDAPKCEDDVEDVIISPSFYETAYEYSDSDDETVIRSDFRRLFYLEIWHSGIRQHILPIYKPQISLGRSSLSAAVDIELQGDEIDRHQAILWKESDNIFNLLVTGQKPVLVGEMTIPQGQAISFPYSEIINIGSYSLKLQNDL